MPFGKLSVSLTVKGAKLNLTLEKGEDKKIFVNRKPVSGDLLRLDNGDLSGEITVRFVL